MSASTANPDLPVYQRRDEIVDSVRHNRVTILVAETGSGKSTQVAQFLASDLEECDRVVCTQPRRIAAISLASYVAKQFGAAKGAVGVEAEDGETVESKDVVAVFGSHRHRADASKIVYTTDNSLLQAWADNRDSLRAYSHVLVDEAHERSLATDLLLAALKGEMAQPEREASPLHLVIMSATIDPVMFKNYFSAFSVKVIEIPGKLYPVKTFWNKTPMDLQSDYVMATVERLENILLKEEVCEGGMLVFFGEAGQAERAHQILRSRNSKVLDVAEVYQLHGRLLLEDQERVFKHSGPKRQVIFATTVAETSITIPNITMVLDTGVCKERRYDADRNVTSLVLGAVSKSSAKQRAGRAGRTAPGACYRMYTKTDFESFVDGRTPEIKSIPLGQAMLKLIALGVTDPRRFDFVESPLRKSIETSLRQLMFLGAATQAGENYALTDLGWGMSHFSLDPRLSKMLVTALKDVPALLYEVIVICAMVSNGGHIFFRGGTQSQKDEADAKKIRFCNDKSDFLTMLNVFMEWSAQTSEREKNEWCRRNFIHNKSMKTIVNSIRDIATTFKYRLRVQVDYSFSVQERDVVGRISRLINACFEENLALFTGDASTGFLLLGTDLVMQLHPGSSMVHSGAEMPKYVVYCELLKTYASFLLHVSAVHPDDEIIARNAQRIEEAGDYLVSRLDLIIAGPRILKRYFLGEKGILKRKLISDVESELARLSGGKPVISRVDIFPGEGRISLSCPSKYHAQMRTFIRAKVDEARDASGFRTMERTLPAASAGCSVIMTQGAVVVEPFLMGNFRTVLIKEPRDRIGLQSCLLDIFPEVKIQSKDNGLFLNWSSPTEAKESFDKLKLFAEELGLRSDQIIAIRKNSRATLTMTLKVQRRKPADIAFVAVLDVPGDDDFEDYGNPPDIDGEHIEINRVAYTLHRTRKAVPNGVEYRISNLPLTTSEDQIRRAVTKLCGSFFGVNVHRPLEKPFHSTGEDLAALDADVRKTIRSIANIGDDHFRLVVRDCQPEYKFFLIDLEFACIETGQRVAKKLLKKSKTLGVRFGGESNFLVSAELALRLRITEPGIFSVPRVNKRIDELVALFSYHKIFTDKESKNPISMELKCPLDDTDFGAKMKEAQELVLGTRPPLTSNVKRLLLPVNWDAFVAPLQAQNDVLLKRANDEAGMSGVVVYGRKKDIESTLKLIESLWDSDEMEEQASQEIDLASTYMAAGNIFKVIVNKFGSDLLGLKQICGVQDASLSVQWKKLTLLGTAKGIEEAENVVMSLAKKLTEARDCEERACSVCMTAPRPQERAVYELCGHYVCVDCLEGQVSAGDLPLRCPAEDCGVLLSLVDLDLVFKSVTKQEALVSRAVDHFLATSNKFAPCPVPDCRAIVPKTTRKAENDVSKLLYFCYACGSNVCTKCLLIWHTGQTCDGTSTDESLKKWLREDPENHKICPYSACGAPIEKIEGCNHMTCTACRTHMCWLCLKIYATGDEVYKHLPYCPQNQSTTANARNVRNAGNARVDWFD